MKFHFTRIVFLKMCGVENHACLSEHISRNFLIKILKITVLNLNITMNHLSIVSRYRKKTAPYYILHHLKY